MITLPASFKKYQTADQLRSVRRIMIGTEGAANTGKTEFALGAPGPGICLVMDRGINSMLDNETPPPTRTDSFVFQSVQVPLAGTQSQTNYLEYWREFWKHYTEALANTDARTVVIDGDSDSWELQTLAEFGKLTQIPPVMRTGLNVARRAMYARAWDSGKFIVATNKIKKKYFPVVGADGQVKVSNSGEAIREWDGATYERAGFGDYTYLWAIQLKHLYLPKRPHPKDPNKILPQKWGVQILMCKANPKLVGDELWGEDCNMQSLLQHVYPHIPLEDWGY